MAFSMMVANVIDSESVSCQPSEAVKSAYGSMTTSKTFLPSIARPIPRFAVVVVLVT